jgi:hypothetical protein
METMESLCGRVATLERHTRAVELRLRLWRGTACGLIALGVLTLPLQSGKADEDSPLRGRRALAQRVAALENKLVHFTRVDNEVIITGANLRIVNGLDATFIVNGLGNLIVGYNELRNDGTDNQTGSHTVVVGMENNFSSFGGFVVGLHNEISGEFASVSGGVRNTASGSVASVGGGFGNTASGGRASVSGGELNTASGISSSVTGGVQNTASGFFSSVSGGQVNMASGDGSSVTGGSQNTAGGTIASVSGGAQNTASGFFSSVSGGAGRTASGEFDWAAGGLFEDF